MSITIGISGGPNYSGSLPIFADISPLCFHDSAVAIVIDGEVKCAVEEERLSRLKHTNAFPSRALQACMNSVGITLEQVDCFAFFFGERFYDIHMSTEYAHHGGSNWTNTRQLLANHISTALQCKCDPTQIHFVRHHDAHCVASYSGSGFSQSLVFVLDGNGEEEAVSIYKAVDAAWHLLRSHPIDDSLGAFYRLATLLLGFGYFGEYKVMGLAPYGDPEPLWNAVSALYKPGKDGWYELNWHLLPNVAWDVGLRPREEGAKLSKLHRDFAASIQKLLEKIVMDLLSWWQLKTDLRKLCVTGGVAHNCAMTGLIARQAIFDEIYVHPAAHDAGAAIGAALVVSNNKMNKGLKKRFSPLIGPKIDTDDEVENLLHSWGKAFLFTKVHSVYELAAGRIAEGAIIGWVRGASEFGPRALGNRSILADPRPVGNWKRINLAIKKRESFRPFAPAVLSEKVHEYFIIPETVMNLHDMVFVVEVKPEYRSQLGAVVHVNGTARIQSVERYINPDFWKLLYSFNKITECGVLLNTSFNNKFEPIVQYAKDAIRTYLTTDLDLLIIGSWVIEKQIPVTKIIPELNVTLPEGTCFESFKCSEGWEALVRKGFIDKRRLSNIIFQIIGKGIEMVPVNNILRTVPTEEHSQIINELKELWEARFIDLIPNNMTMFTNREYVSESIR